MSRKTFAVVSLVVLASMVLTACQPQTVVQTIEVTKIVAGTPVKEQIVVTATPVPPTAVPPTAVPKASDTVIIAMQQEPDTLHPAIGSMTAKSMVLSAVFPGCMMQNEKTDWIPMGCEQIPTLDNGGAKLVGDGADKHLEITYKIRKGWRWTDGTPVTPKDAIYSWKLQMDPDMELPDRMATEKIYDVVAVDESTYTTKFMSEKQAKEAAAGTLKGNVAFDKFKEDYVASGYDQQVGPVIDPIYWQIGWGGSIYYWLPEHILGKIPAKDQAASDYAKKVVGDGAYAVKEWKPGQEIVAEKSDKPFPLGDPKVKTIIFRFFGDAAAVIAALQKGEVDASAGNVGGLSPANAPDLDKLEATGKYKVNWSTGYAWEHIDINTTKFPLDDVKVRQALYYATDKKGIADTLYFGKIGTIDLPSAVAPGRSWAYTDNYTKYPYDPEKAKALLKEAGWDCTAMPCTKKVTEGGKEVTKNLELTLMTTDRTDRTALAQVLQAQWKKINVGVNVQFLYGRGLFATCTAGGPLNCRTFDAAIYTFMGGDDPQFIGQYNCSSINTKENNWTGQNWSGWCDKEADDAIKQSETNAEVTLVRDKRKPYIEKFFQLFTRDVPVIPLFAATEPYPYRVTFKNFKPGPTQWSNFGWNAWQWEISK